MVFTLLFFKNIDFFEIWEMGQILLAGCPISFFSPGS